MNELYRLFSFLAGGRSRGLAQLRNVGNRDFDAPRAGELIDAARAQRQAILGKRFLKFPAAGSLGYLDLQ
jgi:hypothetical protein